MITAITAAERMVSTKLFRTVEHYYECLENHSLMMTQTSAENILKGMQDPTQPGRLPGKLYNSVNKMLDLRFTRKDPNKTKYDKDTQFSSWQK